MAETVKIEQFQNLSTSFLLGETEFSSLVSNGEVVVDCDLLPLLDGSHGHHSHGLGLLGRLPATVWLTAVINECVCDVEVLLHCVLDFL